MAIYKDSEILNETFQALAHETRRQILIQLMEEPGQTAGALGKQFTASQPTISRHISQLERAGLIRREIMGRSHVFFMDVRAISVADGWLTRHRTFWSGNLKRLSNFLDEDK